jgi:plastocyanin
MSSMINEAVPASSTPPSSMSRWRSAPTALAKLTSAAVAGIALSLVYLQVNIIGQVDPALSIFATLLAVVAALIMTGWRWTPLLGAGLSVVVVAANSEAVLYDITHPANFHLFAYMVVAVAFVLVGAVAGISATVQNYRPGARRAPRWTGSALLALATLCMGAILVATRVEGASAGIDPAVLEGLPAITTPDFRFEMPETKINVGDTVALRFDNPHSAPHSFDIDALNVHVPVPAGGSNLVFFRPMEAGTYEYYCSLPGHREEGMVGTLVVDP